MHTITITIENEETKLEILDALSEAEENGDINEPFNVQTSEGYDEAMGAITGEYEGSPNAPFVISDFG